MRDSSVENRESRRRGMRDSSVEIRESRRRGMRDSSVEIRAAGDPRVELRDPRRRAAVPPRRGAFPKGTASLCSGRRSARKASLPSAERPTQPPGGCGGSRGMNAHAGPAKRMPGRRGKKTHTRVRRSSHRSASAVSVSTAKAALCSLLLPSSLQTRSAGLCKEPVASHEAPVPVPLLPGDSQEGLLLSRLSFSPFFGGAKKGDRRRQTNAGGQRKASFTDRCRFPGRG